MTNPPSQITELSGVALSAAIHARDVSCAEVLHAYLAQIDALNPQVNAIVALQDRETLHTQAQRLDSQRGTVGTQVHARGLDLGHADIGGGVEDLAVEVGGVDDVVIDDRDRVGATTEQAEQGGAAEAAGAEDEEVSAALQARAPLAVKYSSSEK